MQFGPSRTDLKRKFEIPANPLAEKIISSMQQESKNLPKVLEITRTLSIEENSAAPPNAPINILVAQGGGAKGDAYVGTVLAIEETGDLPTIDTVVGASAGAINAFMIGLGFSAAQIAELSEKLKFMDFLDHNDSALGSTAGGYKMVQLAGLVASGYVHRGINFHNWAKALLEHMVGDPYITFAEFKKKCDENPSLKQLIFKGFCYQSGDPRFNANSEVTFSFEETPDILVVDALRASMSFPGAFEPWKVRRKNPSNNKLELIGVFADGGIACNFPMEAVNRKGYADPHYPLVETRVGNSQQLTMRNPVSVGLSLCNLSQLDPNITPFTDRLKTLKRAEKPTEKVTPTINEELASRWSTGSILSAIWYNKIGKTSREELREKYDTYPTQTVQIFTEEVPTLGFDINTDPKKTAMHRAIQESGYSAWIKWYAKFQDPSQTYAFETTFEDQQQRLPGKNIDEKIAYFQTLFATILNEATTKNRHPIASFRDLVNNQRIKFASHLITEGIKGLEGHPDLEGTILQPAFDKAIEKSAELKTKQQEHLARAEIIVNEDKALELLQYYIKNDPAKALTLFEGKLSTIFEYMDETQGQILAQAAKEGNPELLKGMLTTLQTTWNMMYQQERKPRNTYEAWVNNTEHASLYSFALQNKNVDPEKMIAVLLENRVDPLQLDSHHKNAFHHAIDQGDIASLETLINWCVENKIPIFQTHFGTHGDTLGHYLIQHASTETLQKLRLEAPGLLNDIMKKQTPNHDGISPRELAAHNIKQDHEIRISCAAYPEKIVNFVEYIKIYNHSYAEKIRERKESLSKIKNAKEEVYKLIAEVGSEQEDGFVITALDYKKFNDILSHLTAKDCLTLLEQTNEDGTNVTCEIAKNPKLFPLAEVLFKKIYAESNLRTELYTHLKLKCNQKSPLYYAAEANNPKMITLLRSYDAPVNDAGPIDSPSALTIAAKMNACDSVVAIIESKPLLAGISSAVTIERTIPDYEGKRALHYLASSSDPRAPETIFKLLNAGYKNFHALTNQLDNDGNSPLRTLIANNQADAILNTLIRQGKGYTTTWYLDTYFDFTSPRKDGYTDLEFAYKTYPTLAKSIIGVHIKDPKLAQHAQAKIAQEQAKEQQRIDHAIHESQLKTPEQERRKSHTPQHQHHASTRLTSSQEGMPPSPKPPRP